jgi:hypothetical protein
MPLPQRRTAHRSSASEPGIAGRLVAAAVDRDIRGRERASDHAPVWIELAEAKSRSSRRRRERDA